MNSNNNFEANHSKVEKLHGIALNDVGFGK